jgi:molecular chaperone DnaK
LEVCGVAATEEPVADTALGLDLGTTFSVVAQMSSGGTPAVLPNSAGFPTTPSVVLFDEDRVVVGDVARESLATEPESVVQLVKRRMGSQWSFDYRGVSYGPEHISSLILRKVHQDAELLVGEAPQVAVTVPAYFNDAMRLATRRAGELAGVEVLGLLSEPTAAALAFGYERRPTGTIGAVIDLRGGTFDVTVMQYDGSRLDVLATGGDAYLGGANFDKVLYDYFVETFRAKHGLDVNDPDALTIDEFTQLSQDWLSKANRAKHDLTARARTAVALQAAGLTLRVDVTREIFEDRTHVLVEEMTEKMLDVVASAGVAPKDVGVVLTVGGATRMPVVRARVEDVFGQAPDLSVRPDEAVALGAALFAAQRQLELGGALVMEKEARDYLETVRINDVAAHTLGVSVFDSNHRQVVVPVLPRNTRLPHSETRTFYTMRPGEERISVDVLEGEEQDPDLCSRVGSVVVEGLPPNRPAHQEVVVTMSLDRDGILEVSAQDVATGAAAATRIEHAHEPKEGNTDADRAVRALIVE